MSEPTVTSWITPPENQGQIVEISYGWGADGEGVLYRRTHDHADGSTVYCRADGAKVPDDWSAFNGSPPLSEDAWSPVNWHDEAAS